MYKLCIQKHAFARREISHVLFRRSCVMLNLLSKLNRLYKLPVSNLDRIKKNGCETTKAKTKVPSFWSSVGFKIGALTRFLSAIFLGPTGKYVIHCIRGEQIFHIQSTVAKRGLTKRANLTSIPLCEKVV